MYRHASVEPRRFAEIVRAGVELDFALSGDWDVSFEVSLYRDYLWQRGGPTCAGLGVSDQRAFDLCLFGEQAVVVIEAKVFEPFSPRQNEIFGLDREHIRRLPGLDGVDVYLVALASSRYYENQKAHGRDGTLDVFDGRLTWADLASIYDDPLLEQADALYKSRPGPLIAQRPV